MTREKREIMRLVDAYNSDPVRIDFMKRIAECHQWMPMIGIIHADGIFEITVDPNNGWFQRAKQLEEQLDEYIKGAYSSIFPKVTI